MVLFYGERTIMWVNKGRLFPIYDNQENRVRNLLKWGEKNRQCVDTCTDVLTVDSVFVKGAIGNGSHG